MPTAFGVPSNNVVALVAPGGYVAGSGTLVLAAGQGSQFPTLSGLQFYRLTVIQQAHAYDPLATPSQFTIYKATGRSGDTFTGLSAIEGTTDRAYAGGDVVDVRVTAGSMADMQLAINNLETRNAAMCQGRLTVTSGDPTGITTSPTGGTSGTLYFTPFRGNLVALYNGSSGWDTVLFAETAIAVPVPASDSLYDVFAYNNSGTLALAFSLPWSSIGISTGLPGVRGESLAFQDGIYVRASDHTRRYLGTIYATSSGTTIDRMGATGTMGQRLVWNYYNRILKKTYTQQSTTSWTYNVSAWRGFNNNAGGLSSIMILTGIQEDFIALHSRLYIGFGVSSAVNSAIGFDTTTPMAGVEVVGAVFATSVFNTIDVDFEAPVVIGAHNYFGLETVVNGVTSTFYGGGSPTYIKAMHWC